jgi:hypothetical protein
MDERREAERLLRHPVAAVLPGDGGVAVAVSVAGAPACTRLAWVDWRVPAILARLSCPPAVPSRFRPVVATDVLVEQGGVADRVLAVRADAGVHAVRVLLASDDAGPLAQVSGSVAPVRLDPNVVVLGVDALDRGGEPVGRLARAGIGWMRLTGGRIEGRRGAGHGMAAGFGAGRWVGDLDEAAFEAGYALRLPGWVPEGLPRGDVHVEPDIAHLSAPPALAVAWGAEPRRVLVRQAPAPLADPPVVEGRATGAAVRGRPATLLSRGRFAALVWEDDDRAFGVQVTGFDAPGEIAMAVARSL